jgi:hypothetical protein
MTPVGDLGKIEEAISECEREQGVRARCYDRWVQDGKFSSVDAKDRLRRMGYAITLLKDLANRLVTSSGDTTQPVQ